MTDYLPASRFLDIGKAQFLPVAADAASQTQGKKRLVDTITSCQTRKTASQDAIKILPGIVRVALPEPNVRVFPDILDEAAQDFCESFAAISKGLLIESVDYKEMQELSSTQSQCILKSNTIAIQKEANAQVMQAQVDQNAAEMASASSTMNWVMVGLGIALIAITVVTGFFDFGASDAAVPEEIELVDAAANGGDALGGAGDAVETSESSAAETLSTGENTTSSTEETAQATENTASNTTQASTSGWRSVLNTIRNACTSTPGKIIIRSGLAAAFGSPILINGIANVNIGEQLGKLSKVQKDVGNALSQVQRNNMYYQFYQQALQRMGGALREETTDASEIVETYAAVASAYRQISYGLANAV